MPHNMRLHLNGIVNVIEYIGASLIVYVQWQVYTQGSFYSFNAFYWIYNSQAINSECKTTLQLYIFFTFHELDEILPVGNLLI